MCVPSLGTSSVTSFSGQTRFRQLPGPLRDRLADNTEDRVTKGLNREVRVTRGLNKEVSAARRLTATVASPPPGELSRRTDKTKAGSSMFVPDQETSSATTSSGQTRWRMVVMAEVMEAMVVVMAEVMVVVDPVL